ncbi:MAG: response regulator transcription factor, partial [Fulvivirga sp.]
VSNYLVVNAYDNAEDAIKNVRKDKPDVILMDLELPGMNGIEAIGIIKKASPHIDLIVNTIYENSDLVFQALVAGASGYITKNTSHTELLDAIEEVINGGAPMSSKIAKMVVASFQKNPNSPLSKRETEVLELLSKGKSYSMIAQELFVTKETAKSHIKNIYSKLQVNSKSEAIAKATKEKLI